jgi:tetratricopeptide (TPR) repeat protein
VRTLGARALLWLACSWAPACASTAPPPKAAPRASARPSLPRFASPFSYEWFVRAELLRARGQHAAAVEAYRNALASAEEDPYLIARLAEALDLAGEPAAARDALRRALELDPQSEAAWLATARIARRARDYDAALHAYERAEVAAPAAATAALELSALLAEIGAGERATAVLERLAARHDPGSRVARRARLELARARGDGAALERAAEAMLEHGLRDPELLRIAAELHQSGQPVLAARVLRVLPPSEIDARLRLQVALALADLAWAQRVLTESSPSTLGGPLAVAAAWLEIGRPAAALDALEERERAHDQDPQARALLRAEALVELGRPGEAARELDAIPPASAHYAKARAVLARALEAAGLPELAHQVTQSAARQ